MEEYEKDIYIGRAIKHVADELYAIGDSSYANMFKMYHQQLKSAKTAKSWRQRRIHKKMAKDLVVALERNHQNGINLKLIAENAVEGEK